MSLRRVKICVLGDEELVRDFLDSLGGTDVTLMPPIKRLKKRGTEFYLWGCRSHLHINETSGVICVVDPLDFYRSRDYLTIAARYEHLDLFYHSHTRPGTSLSLIEHMIQKSGTPFSLGDVRKVKKWIYTVYPLMNHREMIIPKRPKRVFCCF